MAAPLPSFKSPPVIETVVSVQFRPLPRFSNADLGLFWSTERAQFPKRTDADPVEAQTERFGSDLLRMPRMPAFRVVASRGAARLQMASVDGHEMIQVQNGRFLYNWRRLQDGTYPRWNVVFPTFMAALQRFRKFLAAEALGEIEPNQWEVTYVNHLLQGEEWSEPTEWHSLLPGLVGQAAAAAPFGRLEGVESNWRFVLPEQRGRLHVELASAFLGVEPTARELLTLQLTARGGINAERSWDLEGGLHLGREAIVRTFDAITGEEAHVQWGKEA